MNDFIAIDFETATEKYFSACSIGLVAVQNNVIVDRLYYLIQPPENYYSPQNIAIHGMTADNTAFSDTFPIVWGEIKHFFLGSELVLAHNATFDMKVLKACLNYYQLDEPKFEYADSIAISSFFYVRADDSLKNGRSLESRAKLFGIPCRNHHNALNDAEVCANIAIACVLKNNRKSLLKYINIHSCDIKPFADVRLENAAAFAHDKIKISEIAATTAVETTEENFFTGKKFVFTGQLVNLTRQQAMKKVIEAGGLIASDVSPKTNYLVDADGYESGKNKKAKILNEQGADIKVLNEQEFLDLLKTVKK